MNIIWDGLIWLWCVTPRIIRKIFLLTVGVLAIIYVPSYMQLVGRDIVEYNVNGRSPWRSEADARAAQRDWPTYFFYAGLAAAVLVLVLAIWYLFPKKSKKP